MESKKLRLLWLGLRKEKQIQKRNLVRLNEKKKREFQKCQRKYIREDDNKKGPSRSITQNNLRFTSVTKTVKPFTIPDSL